MSATCTKQAEKEITKMILSTPFYIATEIYRITVIENKVMSLNEYYKINIEKEFLQEALSTLNDWCITKYSVTKPTTKENNRVITIKLTPEATPLIESLYKRYR